MQFLLRILYLDMWKKVFLTTDVCPELSAHGCGGTVLYTMRECITTLAIVEKHIVFHSIHMNQAFSIFLPHHDHESHGHGSKHGKNVSLCQFLMYIHHSKGSHACTCLVERQYLNHGLIGYFLHGTWA